MSNNTFTKICLLVILAGGIAYLVIPKYIFNGPNIRKNKFTGVVEILNREMGQWERTDIAVKEWDKLPKDQH